MASRRDGFAPLAGPAASKPANCTQVAVFAPRRGVGATTLARAVAEALATRAAAPTGSPRTLAGASSPELAGEQRVALALLDPRPQRTVSTAGAPAPRLSETTRLLSGSALAAPVGHGLWVVRWSRAARASLLDARAVGELIDQISQRCQQAVYDCEHLINERTLSALDAAQHVLLLTRLTVPSIRATQRVLRICLRLGYPDDKLRIVVNGVAGGGGRGGAHDVISVADAAAALRREVFWQLPEDAATAAAGMAPPGSEFALACVALAEALTNDSAT